MSVGVIVVVSGGTKGPVLTTTCGACGQEVIGDGAKHQCPFGNAKPPPGVIHPSSPYPNHGQPGNGK